MSKHEDLFLSLGPVPAPKEYRQEDKFWIVFLN